MANNFHDNAGLYLVGLDGHVGLHFPPLVVSTFFVSITAVHPFILGGDQQPTVQMNGGRPSVVDQHNPKFLWPHIAFFPDPLDMFTPIHTIFGDQKCWLPRLAVHICGTPAAPTAITGPLSINTECWEFCQMPLSLVFQDGTVQTTPSPDDYKAGVIRYLVETAIDLVIFFATGGFGDGPLAFSKTGLAPAYKEFQDQIIQELRDESIETAGREGMQNIQNAINRSVRDEFVSALFWDTPADKRGWANFGYDVVSEGFGFDPGGMAATGENGMSWDWSNAGKEALGGVVPISGPAFDAWDLRSQQQAINAAGS